MTREERIRAIAREHKLELLGTLCLQDPGVTPETVQALAVYIGALVDESARSAAQYAAAIVAMERECPGSVADDRGTNH